MVQTYASMETFIRERTVEAMDYVSTSAAPFTKLPTKLQDASIFGSLEGVRFRANMLEKSDPQRRILVQRETKAIASSAGYPYSFSSFIFGYDRSNVSPQSIREFLEAIGVGGDPWHHITRISSRVGLGGLPLKSGMENGYLRRNASAHDAENDVAPQEIEDFLRDSLAMAIAFDAFVSRAARLLQAGNIVNLGGSTKLLEGDITLRFLDPLGTGWEERKEGAPRAARIHRGSQVDMTACVARARSGFEMVVTRDRRKWPVDWTTTDLP